MPLCSITGLQHGTVTCIFLVSHIQIATMTKSPYPLLDWIMLGPLLAFANTKFGSPLSEVYVAVAIAVS